MKVWLKVGLLRMLVCGNKHRVLLKAKALKNSPPLVFSFHSGFERVYIIYTPIKFIIAHAIHSHNSFTFPTFSECFTSYILNGVEEETKRSIFWLPFPHSFIRKVTLRIGHHHQKHYNQFGACMCTQDIYFYFLSLLSLSSNQTIRVIHYYQLLSWCWGV